MKSSNYNDLVIRAQNDDIRSFELLVDGLKDMATGYAYSILKDYQSAEDAAQESFIQAYFKLKTLQSPEAFLSWFRKIIFSQCEHFYRKKRLPTLPLEAFFEMQSREQNPEEIIERDELKRLVWNAVKSLPEKERAVTVLFYINEYSMSEIGEFLDLPISAIKNRLFSARKKLKKEMVGIIGDTFKTQKSNKEFTERVKNMDNRLQKILSFYDFNIKNIEKLDKDKEAFKITDNNAISYFLKIFGKSGGRDIIPGENIYNTYEQINYESEILNLLSDGLLKAAVPVKNKNGGFVTKFNSDSDSNDESVYATITSFVDGLPADRAQSITAETAYLTGVSAANLHLESEKKLLPVAVKRPHKRQDYMRKILTHISHGTETGVLNALQFGMLEQCCGVILDCMDKLDEDPKYNTGLVHTDVRPVNCIYTPEHVTFIDFSRSVYSYYLYDLGHIILHGDFGGNPDTQNAVLRGYHSVKPLKKGHLFMTQAFFAMFIMTVMAECIIRSQHNAWTDNVLKWFADDIHPGLISGKGYLDPAVFKDICEI